MSIITISRGSYSKGKEVAERVAQKVGYECISRDIVLEASEEFNVSEIKLIRAIHDAPSILNRFSYEKERYTAYFQAALLQHFRKDNLVYHGLAGHFFVKGVSHVLKVRIIADMEDRVRLEMEREEITRAEALRILKKDDEERKKWSQHLYGIDTSDPILYDLIIHIHKISVIDAVDIICHTVGLKDFQTSSESKKAIDDLALSAEAKAALMVIKHDIKVSAQNGVIFITTEAPISQEAVLIRDIEKIAKNISGVKEVKIDVTPITPFSE
ncbi:MAG: cytidylate kinase family protein [Deltaproteobacteria bacterium]|nr:cytidylate kinase family protein [Deltaproteobacteria bacterium]